MTRTEWDLNGINMANYVPSYPNAEYKVIALKTVISKMLKAAIDVNNSIIDEG